MIFYPHDYQKYAVKYIKEHDISAIFLDMGLGKTIITLTALNDMLFDSFEVRRVLIIAPLRVAKVTWSAEIQKWDHLKNIRYSAAVGDEKERLAALKADEVYLSDSEKEKYEELKKDLVLETDDGEITADNAAALSGKLCQMANGAVYDEKKAVIKIHERKLDALEDIIESMNGKPLLAAYWFKHDFDRISERLHKLHIPFLKLDTPESIARWNKGKIPVALIHPASAGHGLNLQSGGSTLVWYGLTWSLELYQQTVARLWRQGQSAETVVIQHIIAKGTIDEQIMKALSQKNMTQTALIDAVKADLKINDKQSKSKTIQGK